MFPSSVPPPLRQEPVRKKKTVLIAVLITVGVLLVAAYVVGVTYFSARLVAEAEQSLSAKAEAPDGTRKLKFEPLDFVPNSATSDQLRPQLVSWMEKLWQADGLQNPTPETIPAEKWHRLVGALIARESMAPDAPSALRLQALATEILPVADQHPVAAYVVARALGVRHEASPSLLEKAHAGLVERPESATLAFLAAAELAAIKDAGDKAPSAASSVPDPSVQRTVQALRKALAEEAGFSRLHDHVVSYLFTAGARKAFLEKTHLEAYEALSESPQVKPWVKLWIKGSHHIYAAWEARGSGYANTVSPTSARIFHNEIGKAGVSLEAACRENPQSAEPACLLITCALAQSEDPIPDMLTALGMATSVHVDHRPSYTRVFNGLMPRWHGSHPTMVKFGEACLASGRFDSQVPWCYLQAHKEIASEWDLPDYYFLELRDFTKFRELFDGYEHEPSRKPWRTFDRTMAALVSFKCAQYEDAQRWLDKLNGVADDRALEYWGYSDAELLVGKTAAFTGTKGGPLRQAEKAEKAFQAGKALEVYQQALKDGDKLSPAGRTYLRHRCAAMELEAALQGSREFSLRPVPEFLGWTRQGGGWHVLPDGSLEHGGGALMSTTTHQGRVGPRFTLEGEVEFVNPGSKSEAWIAIGYPERADDYHWYAVRFAVEDGRLRTLLSSGMGDTARRAPLGSETRAKFVLSASLNGINLTVNGQPVWQNEPLPGSFVKEQYSQVGIGATTSGTDARILFRDLKIRRK